MKKLQLVANESLLTESKLSFSDILDELIINGATYSAPKQKRAEYKCESAAGTKFTLQEVNGGVLYNGDRMSFEDFMDEFYSILHESLVYEAGIMKIFKDMVGGDIVDLASAVLAPKEFAKASVARELTHQLNKRGILGDKSTNVVDKVLKYSALFNKYVLTNESVTDIPSKEFINQFENNIVEIPKLTASVRKMLLRILKNEGKSSFKSYIGDYGLPAESVKEIETEFDNLCNNKNFN